MVGASVHSVYSTCNMTRMLWTLMLKMLPNFLFNFLWVRHAYSSLLKIKSASGKFWNTTKGWGDFVNTYEVTEESTDFSWRNICRAIWSRATGTMNARSKHFANALSTYWDISEDKWNLPVVLQEVLQGSVKWEGLSLMGPWMECNLFIYLFCLRRAIHEIDSRLSVFIHKVIRIGWPSSQVDQQLRAYNLFLCWTYTGLKQTF